MSGVNRHFVNWIDAYVSLFDPITETPTRLHFWTAVSAIAGALTRRVFIDEVTFRFYPNFCIIFVAPPGIVSKSTTLAHGMALLRELSHIQFAADTTTYPAFVRALASSPTTFRESKGADTLDDVWVQQCAMTAAISELGTFLKVEDEDSVNGFTDLLDCRDLAIKDTKNNGRDEVENPFVNIIGATTPRWIQDKLKAQIGGWGLSSRIIFIYADEKKQFLYRPSKIIYNHVQHSKQKEWLISDLRKIGGLNGPFSFTSAADDLARSWYDQMQQETQSYLRSPDYNDWVGYFLARKQTHLHKLCMILSVAERNDLVIEESHVRAAIGRVDEIQENIISVFKIKPIASALAMTEQAVIEKLGEEIGDQAITKKAALRRISRFLDSTTTARLLDNAIKYGIVEQAMKDGVAWIRIPRRGEESNET